MGQERSIRRPGPVDDVAAESEARPPAGDPLSDVLRAFVEATGDTVLATGGTPAREASPEASVAISPDASADALELALRHRRGVLLAALFAGLAMLALCLALPPRFDSRASILPREPGRSLDGDPMKLGEVLSAAGLALRSGRGQSGAIMAFLESRILRERLIARNRLLPRLYDTWSDRAETLARRALGLPAPPRSMARAIQEGRIDGLLGVRERAEGSRIEITWRDRDPAFAARMLASVLDELQGYLDTEYVSDASRHRAFVESQLEEARRDLAAWEGRMPDPATPLGRIQREVKGAGEVAAHLRQELAVARIEEARQVLGFKVLDPPFVPEKKSWPRTGLATAGAFAGGLLAALAAVFLREAVRRRKTPHRAP